MPDNVNTQPEKTVKTTADQLYAEHQRQVYVQTDRMFAVLMSVQWLAGIVAALVISPRTWIGQTSEVHMHVWAAILLGGVISVVPIAMAVFKPGETLTRYTVAVGQVLMSSLLIHITGGRIETHFHVFVSLAFLAFYRDWKVLVPATVIVALDHMLRGIFYPQSVFGIFTQENWRWLEHAAWVIFEDTILVLSCIRAQREMRDIAEKTANLDASEARYRIVTDSASDAIITIDESSTILFVNKTTEEIFGYEHKELIGEKLLKLIAGRKHTAYLDGFKSYAEQGKRNVLFQSAELPAVHKDGHEFSIEVSFGEHIADGERIFTAIIRDITERKQTEEELRRSEEYQNLFKHAGDAILILDPETALILNVNDNACRVYGYSREKFVGMKVSDLSASEWDLSEDTGSYESIHSRADGTQLNLLVTYSFIEFEGRRAIMSINRDISARVAAEAALRASETKHRTLIENMSEGLLQVDLNNSIVFVNQRFCEMTGYRREELIGHDATELFDETGKKMIATSAEAKGEGSAENFECQIHTAQGKSIWSLVGVVPTYETNGKLVGSMSVHTDITERKRAEEKLVHNAMHDSLTGLPNRGLFLEHLRRALGRSPRRKKTFAVLFLDFDGFKLVNDSLGHLEGDTLLKLISRRLQSMIRRDDVVARLGGDEFTILLDDLTEPQDAFVVADKIQEVLTEPFMLGEREIYIGASIGIVLRDEKYEAPDEMLRDADIAMYRAKSTGKGRYAVFNKEMHDHLSNRLRLETELRQAVDRNEFRLVYQPIVEILDDRLIGFEALVRWHHPTRGEILPGEFIPVLEETGLIAGVGEWVLRESCRQLREWHVQFPERRDLHVSVNLSCKQFLQQDLAKRIKEILDETHLDSKYLRLEITESHVMENSEMAITIMNRIRDIGVRMSIDDFGTGYSSLSYLQRLPITYLKIDRSFINLMNSKHENGEIVRAIVMLAKNLNMQVIAEGIETEDQAKKLASLDCAFGQGYFYSRPSDAAAVNEMLNGERLKLIPGPEPSPGHAVDTRSEFN